MAMAGRKTQSLGAVDVCGYALPEAVFAQGKARVARFGCSKQATSNAGLCENSPGPFGLLCKTPHSASANLQKAPPVRRSLHCLRHFAEHQEASTNVNSP